ncbi:serine/threonine protein kinase [Anatilimnocola floriformis]|uniref:serine/threonine protein kinase n=1 Tax=Anatilimnocola floriformis TaxID=2948575 RepID=UPI0020C3BD28|nr:serine/threonine-protein kinase [Anatilimnocola floriformis]
MSGVSPSGANLRRREFLTVAEELAVLSAPTVALLREQSSSQGVPPIQLALQKALVTPTQIDIIETLCRPLEIVPGYEITNMIGQGGMGVVFRAKQLSLDRDVAIKLVPLHQLAGDVAVKRFEVEAQVVAKLQHPNIVAAYDFGRHEGRLYFVMELVEGLDADHHIRRHGVFDETTAWQIVRQAAAGLAAAQHTNVVHRDVKPANILLVRPPAGYPLPTGVPLAKLGDFGLAWLTTASDERTRLTSTNVTLGSPHYMSPEQLNGDVVDYRTDIYSLGATAFHLLSGLPPMAGFDITKLMAMKLQGKTESLRATRPDITPTSADLVDELMAHEPGKRPQDYGLLIERIDELIGQQGLSASRRMLMSTQLSVPTPTVAMPADPQAVTRPSPRDAVHSETVEMPTESPKSQRTRILAAAAIALVCLALGAVAFLSLNGPGAPDLVPSENVISLPYQGASFNDWKRLAGSRWASTTNDDQENVLEGDGVLIRRFPELATAANGNLQYFRLELFVELHDAKVLEVHVDVPEKINEPGDDRRVVLRITPQGSQVGNKRGDLQGWLPRSSVVPLRKTRYDKHAVRIERHSSGWYAFVDNDPVGFDFSHRPQVSHEFRLVAEDGEAWFSDFVITELAPRSPK